MAAINKPIVVGLGEALWDLLPEGKRAGGAPANFAYHAAALGAKGVVVSSVGDDPLGHELIEKLDSLGVSREYVAVDGAYPTGTVSVALDTHGDAAYTIHQDVAWDYILFTPELASLAGRADAVCVGTLAQRSESSRDAIRSFLDATRPDCIRILDVNLRQVGHEALVAATLSRCDVIKLNDDEWPIVARTLGVAADVPGGLEALRKKYRLRLAALTLGARGSMLCSAAGVSIRGGADLSVVDTVGAGDAFTAAVVLGLLRGDSLEKLHRHAEEVASYVCTRAGATPTLPESMVDGGPEEILQPGGSLSHNPQEPSPSAAIDK